MTTNKHTPLPFGGPLTSAAMNAPLAQLDTAIGLLSTTGSGGWYSQLDGTAASGQKVIPVTSTPNADAVGLNVFIGSPAGTHEEGAIASISAGVSVTLVTNLTNTYSSGTPISATPAEVADARGGHATLGEAIAAAPVAGVRVAPYGPAQQQAAYIYDDFDRADGTLNGMVAPTGQTWECTGTGAATVAIVNRRMVSATNVYTVLDYGSTINRISGTFSMSPAGIADRPTASVVIIADQTNGGLGDILHLILSPTSWTLQKRLGGGAFTAILSGGHDLIADVPYNIAFEIDGDTVTVYPPQGSPVSVTDADVGGIAPRYGIWQIGINPGGAWWRVSMGPDQQGRVAAASGAAPAAEASWSHGLGLTRHQRISATLSGGAGWYRIANRAGALGFVIVGQVTIYARDPYRSVFLMVDIKGKVNGILTPAQTFCVIEAGWPINAVRLSRDSGTSDLALDVNVPNADPVEFYADLVGFFEIVTAPVVGATALATQALTLTPSD